MTWQTGFAAYLDSYEVRLHRRQDTFNGRLWPDPRPGLISPSRQIQIANEAMKRRRTA